MKRIISTESIHIPFKAKFTHHSAHREFTESIVVSIENENGQVGYGESCPRSYVTGESVSSANKFIEMHSRFVETVESLEELYKIEEELKEKIDANPAAWCALEMAILDLLAKERKKSVEELLKIQKGKDQSAYTAVLGIDSLPTVLIKILIYKILRFRDFKLKLSGKHSHDMRILKLLSFGASQIRLDANNLFKNSEEAIEYLKPMTSFIWAIEEPLKVGDFSGMKKMASTLNIKIILDESFLSKSSLEGIEDATNVFIPNVRISKLGGVLRTLRAVEYIEGKGFKWILGSHVGECSLLTRSSFLVCENRKHLMAKEGGFSTHLLIYDPFFPNLKIETAMKIKHKKEIKANGWGMTFINKRENRK